jgi:hypothetical protein
MPPVGFEPAILASERLQSYASNSAPTGIGKILHLECYCYKLDQIKNNEMGGAFGTYGGRAKCMQDLYGET